MKTINFYDIGSFDGMESEYMITLFKSLNIDNYHIYLFEPCLSSFEKINKKFLDNKKVSSFNLAISFQDGVGKLFHSPNNEPGNSIFDTKNNISKNDFEEIKTIKFSKWLKENNLNDKAENFNIIKFNIEGAEWYLIKDLIENELINSVDMFCGDIEDIYKIGELKDNINEFKKMILDNDIHVYPFSAQGYEKEQSRVKKEIETIKEKIIKGYE